MAHRFQRGQHPLAPLFAPDPAVIDSNPDDSQTEADGGNAAIGVGPGTVADQAIRRIRLIPEVVKCSLLQITEKVFVVGKAHWPGAHALRIGTFLLLTADRAHAIETSPAIGQVQVGETPQRDRLRSDFSEPAVLRLSAINAISCEVGARVALPVQHDASIT